MESFGGFVNVLLGIAASSFSIYLGIKGTRKLILHIVGPRDVLVVTSTKQPNKIITRAGEPHWQNPVTESVRRISWASDPREIDISRAGPTLLLKFKAHCITQERLKATLRCYLHINVEDSFDSLQTVYDAWKTVISETEHVIQDFISTLSVGEIRPQRHQLQKDIQKQINEPLQSYGVHLSKVGISSNIEFAPEIEDALAEEANIKLKGRATLAKAKIDNTIAEDAVASEATNRKTLAEADAESIAAVIPQLQDPKEAARFIVLMRYAYELSRLGPGVIQEVSFSKLLDTIRELLSPLDAVVVEEVKTSKSARPRSN